MSLKKIAVLKPKHTPKRRPAKKTRRAIKHRPEPLRNIATQSQTATPKPFIAAN
jgi:hypothetical protein